MKNLIDPKTLVALRSETVTMEEIVNFLDNHSKISIGQLANLINVDKKKIYNYKGNQARKKRNSDKLTDLNVVPKSASKKYNRYSAEEKYALVEKYLPSSDAEKTEILRKYGLYQADISRWKEQIKEASLAALGKRKTRSDKKSKEEITIEELRKDLAEQEKTTAKLSTLLIFQKKTFDMLKRKD